MMHLRQLSIFLENKAGRIAEVTQILGDNDINILGFSVADMADYGIFRILVSDTDRAKMTLKEADFTVTESPLICVDVPHRPGGLATVLKVLSDADINVEYLYAIVSTLIVFSVDRPDEATDLLQSKGMRVLDWEAFKLL